MGAQALPQVTKDWILGMDKAQLEKVLALGAYNRRAVLLFIHTDEWFHAHFVRGRSRKQKEEIFWAFFIPYYTLSASMVYVVHEGLTELEVEDKKLEKIRVAVDMRLLKRLRNATFHFQTRFRSPKHDEFITQKGFGIARELFERQDFLVRKMIRFSKDNPHSASSIM